MMKMHCDNCDVVIGGPQDPHALSSVLRDGSIVHVETVVVHPITRRRVDLCVACAAAVINAAAQSHQASSTS